MSFQNEVRSYFWELVERTFNSSLSPRRIATESYSSFASENAFPKRGTQWIQFLEFPSADIFTNIFVSKIKLKVKVNFHDLWIVFCVPKQFRLGMCLTAFWKSPYTNISFYKCFESHQIYVRFIWTFRGPILSPTLGSLVSALCMALHASLIFRERNKIWQIISVCLVYLFIHIAFLPVYLHTSW